MPSKLHDLFEGLRKRATRIALGFVFIVVFACQAGGWISLPFMDRLDGIIYDVRLRLTAPGGVDPRVVIVDIDEKSLREREAGGEGRWPWRVIAWHF